MFRASGADLARDRGAKQKERATVRVRARVREPNSNRLQPTVRAMASNLIERERETEGIWAKSHWGCDVSSYSEAVWSGNIATQTSEDGKKNPPRAVQLDQSSTQEEFGVRTGHFCAREAVVSKKGCL